MLGRLGKLKGKDLLISKETQLPTYTLRAKEMRLRCGFSNEDKEKWGSDEDGILGEIKGHNCLSKVVQLYIKKPLNDRI